MEISRGNESGRERYGKNGKKTRRPLNSRRFHHIRQNTGHNQDR